MCENKTNWSWSLTIYTHCTIKRPSSSQHLVPSLGSEPRCVQRQIQSWSPWPCHSIRKWSQRYNWQSPRKRRQGTVWVWCCFAKWSISHWMSLKGCLFFQGNGPDLQRRMHWFVIVLVWALTLVLLSGKLLINSKPLLIHIYSQNKGNSKMNPQNFFSYGSQGFSLNMVCFFFFKVVVYKYIQCFGSKIFDALCPFHLKNKHSFDFFPPFSFSPLPSSVIFFLSNLRFRPRTVGFRVKSLVTTTCVGESK